MELKEFVKETLIQIAEGIESAQNELKGKGTIIAPKSKGIGTYSSSGEVITCQTYYGKTTHYVEFEAHLIESESSNKKAGIGVFLPNVLTAGTENKKGNEVSSSAKIKFAVPIVYPIGDLDDNGNTER